jgi:hypothetical protein
VCAVLLVYILRRDEREFRHRIPELGRFRAHGVSEFVSQYVQRVIRAVVTTRGLTQLLTALRERVTSRRTDSAPEEETPLPQSVVEETSVNLDDAIESDESLIEGSASALDEGNFRIAVILGYAAIRSELATDSDDQYLTHREFLDKCRTHDGAEGERQIETITEGFEYAVYTDRPLSEDEAAEYYSHAAELLTFSSV